MKTTIKLIVFLILFIFSPQIGQAQFFKKLTKKTEEKIEREAEKRAELVSPIQTFKKRYP